MKNKINYWGFFQNLGKSFMLPVSLLAFMGIILGIGSSFSSSVMIDKMPVLANPVINFIFQFMATLGSFAFSNLAILFAIAIPIGLAKNEKAIAAFSGFVGYMVLNMCSSFMLTYTGHLADSETIKSTGQGVILGIQTVDTGILGGIFVGIVVNLLHQRFYTISLPNSLSFFSGTRFVAIITSIVMGLVGLILPFIWPFFAAGIKDLGILVQKAGAFGPFLFGAGERLLLPFGLHHILVSMVRFTEIGGTTFINGQKTSGALTIFYSELKNGLPIMPEYTRFLSQGKMPSFLFGLPGAALAMYQCSLKENKLTIRGLLLSGVITCMIAGITEPLEFLFLFVAPVLYVFHSLMTGLGFMVMSMLHVTIGNTDGNLIDLFVFGILQGMKTKWYVLIFIGPIWFFAYYFVFRFYITKFNVPTIGRVMEGNGSSTHVVNITAETKTEIARNVIKALGGKENITSLDNCLTRLRLEVNSTKGINPDELKSLGAMGVVILNDTSLQVIFGPKVNVIKNEMDKIIKNG